jgi:hypothetical protein
VTCATAVLFVALTHGGGDTAEAATPTTYTKADATASYEVTLSGRADRCGSLREAIHSLD